MARFGACLGRSNRLQPLNALLTRGRIEFPAPPEALPHATGSPLRSLTCRIRLLVRLDESLDRTILPPIYLHPILLNAIRAIRMAFGFWPMFPLGPKQRVPRLGAGLVAGRL